MPVRVKITPFAESVKILVDSRLSPQARSERVAAFARDRIARADEINRQVLGAVPPKTVTVDGSEGAALESVNPDHGIIIAEWRMVGDVIQWIMQTLRERSPVVSGDYQDGHALYVDGEEVDSNNPPIAATYVFSNSVPYSRKIEIGKTESGRDFVIQVPNQIYRRTADDAKARFGNIADIRFTYQSIQGGAIGKWASSASAAAHASRHHRRTRITEWLTNQPAIIVQLR
jgi:hypothetical protein